jgi:hypothetical protein
LGGPRLHCRQIRDELLKLHRQIKAEGALVTHSSRVLIEARKP